MPNVIVPICINAPKLATVLEDNAGTEYLTETRKVRARKLLSAYAHEYPVPPQALGYIRQYHNAYLNDEAQAQLKAADPYVPGSSPTREDADESRSSADTGARRKNPTVGEQGQTSGALSSLQQRIAKRPKLDLEGIPEGYQTEEFLKIMELMYETNSAPCYDAESIALGSLEKAEYFLMPDALQFEPCAVDNICRGSAFWKPDVELVAQVYALAKEQALKLGITGDNQQIKWAVLRTQAFSAGWYHGQKYSRFCSPPKNSANIYAADMEAIEKYLSDAWKLVGFLPFLHEFAFRTVGNTWSSLNALAYEGRVRKFAEQASVGHCLSYMTGKDLYGPALQWIGVELPMKVLERNAGGDAVPTVFAIRTRAAPAGKSLITTTQAVVKQLRTLDCWESIQNTGKLDDTQLSAMEALTGKIQANPWKYHAMPDPYNLEPLSEEEELEVAAAGKCAEEFAPITFAFTQAVMRDYQLPGYMVLKKHAEKNGFMYGRYMFCGQYTFFASIKKKIAADIGATVVAEASGIPREHVTRRTRSRART